MGSRDLRELEDHLLGTLANEIEHLHQSLIGVERSCYSYGGNNVDKYVSCMEKKTERIDDEQQKFELRKAFFQHKFVDCKKAAQGNPEATQQCKNDTIEKIRKCFTDFTAFVQKS